MAADGRSAILSTSSDDIQYNEPIPMILTTINELLTVSYVGAVVIGEIRIMILGIFCVVSLVEIRYPVRC